MCAIIIVNSDPRRSSCYYLGQRRPWHFARGVRFLWRLLWARILTKHSRLTMNIVFCERGDSIEHQKEGHRPHPQARHVGSAAHCRRTRNPSHLYRSRRRSLWHISQVQAHQDDTHRCRCHSAAAPPLCHRA